VILLACAVEKELEGWTVPDGVEVLVTGVGPVEAATAVSRALASRRYSLVVNAGIAGAFDGAGVNVGDAVVVSEDALELDREDGTRLMLPGGASVADRAESDPDVVARVAARGFTSLRGWTVTRVTTTEATAARLAALGAQTESMEGFAVLRAAQRHGIAAVQFRGISNRVGSPQRSAWSLPSGVTGLGRILDAFFALPYLNER
jgi:futalosine hydrolase